MVIKEVWCAAVGEELSCMREVEKQGRSQGGAQGAFAPPFSSIDYIANCYFDFLLYKYQH